MEKKFHTTTINIPSEAYKALKEHCAIAGQTATKAIERAILACYGGKVKEEEDDNQ